MKQFGWWLCIFAAVSMANLPSFAQGQSSQPSPDQDSQIPIDTKMTLDAAPPVQKPIIRSIIYLECPKTNMKGTAFLLSRGLVVTAAHVICGCEVADLRGRTALGQFVEFSKLTRDEDRDLAALRPKLPLKGGLELATDENAAMGEHVNTWGFPLIYDGPAPILSVGYVSRYYQARAQNSCDPTRNQANLRFKHIIVNAAFNPGNSGGPLFVFGRDKVIGVVVWKSVAFSGQVKEAIKGFHNARATVGGTFFERQPDGTLSQISNEEVIARVLEEFYNKVQVHIGEAVSVSELQTFLKEHAGEL